MGNGKNRSQRAQRRPRPKSRRVRREADPHPSSPDNGQQSSNDLLSPPSFHQEIQPGGIGTQGGQHSWSIFASSVENGGFSDASGLITQRLAQTQNQEISRRSDDLGWGVDYYPHRSAPLVDSLIRQQSWSTIVDKKIATVQDGLIKTEKSTLISAIESWRDKYPIDECTFSRLRSALAGIEFERIEAAIWNNSMQDHHAESFQATRAAIDWLRRNISTPKYQNIACVSGSYGSGRTRLLVEFARRASESGSIVIFADPANSSDTVEDAINRYLQRATALPNITISMVREGLAPIQGQSILVIIDDIDIWARENPHLLSNLAGTIDSLSRVPRLRWVFSAHTLGLGRLGSRVIDWRQYALDRTEKSPREVLSKLERATSWIDIDQENTEQSLGLRILASTDTHATELHSVIDQRDQLSHENEQLSSPLAALIRQHAMDGQRSLVTDLNSVDFIRAYWSWIKTNFFHGDPAQEEELESAVRRICRDHIASPDASLIFAHDDSLLPPLRQLERIGVVRLLEEGENESDSGVRFRLVTNFDSFWGFRMSRIILTRGSRLELGELRANWWPRASNGEWVAESTCQFILSGSANSASEDNLWTDWSASAESPKSPFFLAALSAPSPMDRIAIDVIAKQSYQPKSARELFSALRFTSGCIEAGWPAERRLRVLLSLERNCSTNGFLPFMHWSIIDIIEASDLVRPRNYVDVLEVLNTIHSVELRRVVCESLVESRRSVFATDAEWIKSVLKFCQRVSNPTGNRGSKGSSRRGSSSKSMKNIGQDDLQKSKRATTDDTSEFLTGMLTTAISSALVHSKGAGGVRLLAQVGWWDAENRNVNPKLAQHMRRDLNLVYGASFHFGRASDRDWKELERILSDLSQNRIRLLNRKNSEVMFYILKHSVPTYGRSDVVLPSELVPWLSYLASDRAFIDKLDRHARELFSTNQIALSDGNHRSRQVARRDSRSRRH